MSAKMSAKSCLGVIVLMLDLQSMSTAADNKIPQAWQNTFKKNPDISTRQYVLIKPLRANFFRGSINMYLHFTSFLHFDMAQVIEILPHVRQGPPYST